MLTKFRVAGSGGTFLIYSGTPILYCEQLDDSGEKLMGEYEFIIPIYSRKPIEICSPYIITGGELVLTIREIWNREVWDESILPWLPEGSGLRTIRQIVNLPEIVLVKVIAEKINRGGVARRIPIRFKVYYNCRIVDGDMNESVNIQKITIPKTVKIAYTHSSILPA